MVMDEQLVTASRDNPLSIVDVCLLPQWQLLASLMLLFRAVQSPANPCTYFDDSIEYMML